MTTADMSSDVLVIGSGVAGLSFALKMAEPRRIKMLPPIERLRRVLFI